MTTSHGKYQRNSLMNDFNLKFNPLIESDDRRSMQQAGKIYAHYSRFLTYHLYKSDYRF